MYVIRRLAAPVVRRFIDIIAGVAGSPQSTYRLIVGSTSPSFICVFHVTSGVYHNPVIHTAPTWCAGPAWIGDVRVATSRNVNQTSVRLSTKGRSLVTTVGVKSASNYRRWAPMTWFVSCYHCIDAYTVLLLHSVPFTHLLHDCQVHWGWSDRRAAVNPAAPLV